MSHVFNKLHALRRLFADTKGASAVEFSLVLLPFVLLTVGTMELGRYYFTVQNLRTVVAEAARKAIVDTSIGTSASLSGVNCTSGTANLLDAGETATVAQRTPFLNINELLVCVQNDAGPGDVTVIVKAVYSFTSALPFISQLNGAMGQESTLKFRRL